MPGVNLGDFPPAIEKSWWTEEMLADAKKWTEKGQGFSFGDFQDETMTALGFCGCGNPDVIIEKLVAYLEYASDEGDFDAKVARHPIHGSDAFIFCAYIADKQGWTDHGGSVYGAWMTGVGCDWLDAAREWLKSEGEC